MFYLLNLGFQRGNEVLHGFQMGNEEQRRPGDIENRPREDFFDRLASQVQGRWVRHGRADWSLTLV